MSRYLLRDGTLIADSWSDLVDGTIDAPIRVDEKGAWIADDATPYAWTDTSAPVAERDVGETSDSSTRMRTDDAAALVRRTSARLTDLQRDLGAHALPARP